MTASKPAPSQPAGPTQPPSGPRHPTPTGPSPTGPSRPSGHLPYGYSDPRVGAVRVSPRDAVPVSQSAGVGSTRPESPGRAAVASTVGESNDARHSDVAGASSGLRSDACPVGAGTGTNNGTRCRVCGYLVAGFRGRLIHVDDTGGVVRGLDHDPELAPPMGTSFSLPQPKPFDIAVNESLARRSR